MVRPAYFFITLTSLLLAICSRSLAQETTENEPVSSLSGQDWTGVDNEQELALEQSIPGEILPLLSGEILSGAGQSGMVSDSIFSQTGVDEGTGISTGYSLPQVIVSEVFFDGSDEWVEVSNLGSETFSGLITFSGNSITTSLSLSISSGESLVIGKSGRTFPYIIDQSVIKYSSSMGFTDTKEIKIFAYWSGELLDSFLVDTGTVVHYNDKKTSLEKIDGIITGATLERQLNVISGYIANPGSYDINFIHFPPSSGDIVDESFLIRLSGVCQSMSNQKRLSISEVFFGNNQRDFYIEILANQDVQGDELTLSGSFLQEPLTISLAPLSGQLQQGRRLIISSGSTWANEPIIHIDNQRLAGVKTGGFLQILVGSGQSGQVLDIVSLGAESVGSSLYFGGNSQQCMRNFTKRGRFSPGFDEVFLMYFPGMTGYKIICDPQLSIYQTQSQVSCQQNSTTTSGVNISTGSFSTGIVSENSWTIKIISIDYDPEGSDIGNEKIILEGSSSLGLEQLFLQKPDRYLKIGTTKRYLSGIMVPGIPLTIQGSFSFPNSSKSGEAITVQLRYQNQLMDSYSYLPVSSLEEKKTISPLTGDFQVREVIDGDTFKIWYQTGEQSIRLLGLDAPEISLLRTKKKGCFAEQSKKYLENLIGGKQVRLEFDATQNKTDSYKRRLNYVYIDDILVNEEMIAQGYAKEYTFKIPYQKREQFLLAQNNAQTQELGLRNNLNCSGNLLTGTILFSGDILSGEEFLSGWEAVILSIIPNPKGKDEYEQIIVRINNEEGRMKNGGSFLMTGFSFSINGKKKKIKDQIPVNEETLLSGKFSFPNKAACVSLLFQNTTLDTICYPQPKEGEIFYADGHKEAMLSNEEQRFLASIALKKIENTMCAFYGNLQIDCNNIPSGKTSIKLKNENKVYKSFVNLLNNQIKQEWGDIYYNSSIKLFFTLLWSAKKQIDQGIYTFSSSHGDISLSDIPAQIQLLETYSPAYRARKFGMVLLNEI